MSPADAAALAGLLAAPAVGSFIGSVIVRLPQGGAQRRGVILGRSHCPHCGQRLAARDLVPLVSWLVLKGRCRTCGAALGWFYPLVELASVAVALTAAAALSDAPVPVLAVSLLLGWTLLVLAWIDARHLFMPDALTLTLIPAGLLASWALEPGSLADHALGALAGGGGLWLVAAVYRRLRKREGLGGGDIKLMAAAGAWVSWQGLPSVLLLASLSGLAVGLARAVRAHRPLEREVLAFGPFIALGFWTVWLLGPLRIG